MTSPGAPLSLGACTPAVAGTACASTSTSTLSHNGGTAHTVSAAYTHTGNFVDSTGSLSSGQTVNKKTLTASIINDPTKPYDGNMNATLTSANFQLSGLVSPDDFTVTKTTGTYNSKDVAAADTVSTSLASGDFTPVGSTLADNYNLPTTASGPGHITQVTLTASIIGNPTKPYNCNMAATLAPANFSLSGLIGTENFTVTQTVGAYNSKDVASATTVTASLAAGDFTPTNGAIATNYVLPTTASDPGQITPVDASITVTPYTSPTTVYNCNNHTATGSATGCDGDLSSLLDLSGTIHKDAGTYNGDPSTFNAGSANPNYNSKSGTVDDSIAKAPSFAAVTVSDTVYNCLPQGGTAMVTDVCGLSQSLPVKYIGRNTTVYGPTNTAPTNAGDYTGQARYMGDANHLESNNSKDFSIAKADANITVNPYHVTYDCNAHMSTGSATGVCSDPLSSLLHLPASHTDAGDYPSDGWTFDGNSNYNATSSTVHNQIDKADTTSSVASNHNPSIINQNVTFTATVAGNPAVTCTPTGTVTFKDGSTTLMAGVALSGGSATFSTSSLSAGNHTITAVYSGDSNFNATGATAGSTATPLTQQVHYNFNGFLPPVDNLPIWNSVKGGQTIPIKWQLTDNNGTIICDLNTLATPNGLTSIQTMCPGGAAVIDPIEEVLASPGSTVFRCDGTQFIYNWQTSKPWNGTCRLMTVRLADGTTHTAQFTFK